MHDIPDDLTIPAFLRRDPSRPRIAPDLGRKLSAGERRDLLKDNTSWHSDVVAAVVDELETDSN